MRRLPGDLQGQHLPGQSAVSLNARFLQHPRHMLNTHLLPWVGRGCKEASISENKIIIVCYNEQQQYSSAHSDLWKKPLHALLGNQSSVVMKMTELLFVGGVEPQRATVCTERTNTKIILRSISATSVSAGRPELHNMSRQTP